MSRVTSRGGLSRGVLSASFTTEQLATELRAAQLEHDTCVYVESDEVGGVRSEGCVAGAVVRARLAPHVQACTAALQPSRDRWRLALLTDLAPQRDLLLWFHEDVLARVRMPFLTLQNIHGKKDYVCHACGTRFEHPNPLKVHLFLNCREYTPVRFWKKFISRVSRNLSPTAVTAESVTLKAEAHWPSAFHQYAALPGVVGLPPAQIEALATDWGKSRNGHLCLYCGKLYSRKYGLKIHIRTHTGYKPLRCKYCLRAFGDPSNLNKHVRLHAHAQDSRGARHECAQCGVALARRRDLERHLRTRHCPRDKVNVSDIDPRTFQSTNQTKIV